MKLSGSILPVLVNDLQNTKLVKLQKYEGMVYDLLYVHFKE